MASATGQSSIYLGLIWGPSGSHRVHFLRQSEGRSLGTSWRYIYIYIACISGSQEDDKAWAALVPSTSQMVAFPWPDAPQQLARLKIYSRATGASAAASFFSPENLRFQQPQPEMPQTIRLGRCPKQSEAWSWCPLRGKGGQTSVLFPPLEVEPNGCGSKIRPPRWNLGKWKPAVPWWFNFDPHPYDSSKRPGRDGSTRAARRGDEVMMEIAEEIAETGCEAASGGGRGGGGSAWLWFKGLGRLVWFRV